MPNVIDHLIRKNIGCNTTCQKCREAEPDLTNALGPWFVRAIEHQSKDILFVGKVARNDGLGEELNPRFEDVQIFGSEFIKTSSWAYWSYTRDILIKLFGDINTGISRSSFTNMVKCNNRTTPDTTSVSSKEFCITHNEFIWQEVEVIRPKLIIFYTHWDYDEYLVDFKPSISRTYKDLSDTTVSVGAKEMPWWDRVFYDEQSQPVLRFLRVGHPERKEKLDFVRLLSDWAVQAGIHTD